MRLRTDGYLDLRDPRRVKTPGLYERDVEPTPEGEAVRFLLSHSFPGHRKIVRPLTEAHRSRIRMAIWAASVAERMSLVDRVWRQITEPVMPPSDPDTPQLLQVVAWGDRAFPIYLDGGTTRVIPEGGMPVGAMDAPEPPVNLKTA